MRRTRRMFPLVVIACFVFIAAFVYADDSIFRLRPDKQFTQPIPDLPLTAEQVETLKAQKPVCLLVPTRGELKAGFMRVILPVDPVTIWWITQDIEHFHLNDPDYPKTGSLSVKRRSLMPYVFDGAMCVIDGRRHLYQLVVAPFVAPRVYSLARYPDRDGFPWESAWKGAKELVCSEKRDPAFEKYFKKAVQPPHNNGCWRVQPVPERFRTKPEDALMTYIQYYVDTHPGGNIAALTPIVNKSTSVGMPNIHENLLYQGLRWEEHLRKYHAPEELERYRAEVRAFRKAMGFSEQP